TRPTARPAATRSPGSGRDRIAAASPKNSVGLRPRPSLSHGLEYSPAERPDWPKRPVRLSRQAHPSPTPHPPGARSARRERSRFHYIAGRTLEEGPAHVVPLPQDSPARPGPLVPPPPAAAVRNPRRPHTAVRRPARPNVRRRRPSPDEYRPSADFL